MTPERRAQLEEEREFLLRSLEDLEREREAGDVDDADYASLQDGYTARAAAVLRELGEVGPADQQATVGEPPASPAEPAGRRSWTRVAAWTAFVVVVAVGAGFLVSRTTGERLPGQVASGNPDDDSVSSLLRRAAALSAQDPAAAIDLYSQVLAVEPDNVEALTYLGWLTAVTAEQRPAEDRGGIIEAAALLLRQATTIDDTYADPHCFLGIVFANFVGDLESAEAELQRCLDLNPPSQQRQMVEGLLARVQEAMASEPPSSDPAGSEPPVSDPSGSEPPVSEPPGSDPSGAAGG